MKRTTKSVIGYVRKRGDIGKHVIDYRNHLLPAPVPGEKKGVRQNA